MLIIYIHTICVWVGLHPTPASQFTALCALSMLVLDRNTTPQYTNIGISTTRVWIHLTVWNHCQNIKGIFESHFKMYLNFPNTKWNVFKWKIQYFHVRSVK